ncbi:ankyrin repeat-containing domain protein [Infundibulicybe gibba]|nr:ankyrin repeat-containing domain protein [Infundibulicybe gibba]
MESSGASNNERLLAAARSDNEDLILDVLKKGGYDINCQDGLGNTPLHNAVAHGSTDVLEHILSDDGCDVDPLNRIDKATPLHLAIALGHKELRKHIVSSLLDAGADTTIKDKNGETVLDIIPADDHELRQMIQKSRAQASVSVDDVASDGEGDSAGSGSDSE